ncbi:hypothetical protein [Glycomyces rhizosphaerae]|uniref:Uncharacterized protein n=1 Tax=Glycomyces rhizosphaerae TaxID=2054422 RepID=A0ABV7PTW4_9ACTN
MTAPSFDRLRRHPLIAGVALFNAFGAASGAIGLITGWLSLGDKVTDRLPWGSPVIAGVALGVIVALPNTALAIAAMFRGARCGPLSILAGTLLICWIIVQLAFIREFSFFQPFYTVIGLAQIWMGVRVLRERS